jgi:hypothetical protein
MDLFIHVEIIDISESDTQSTDESDTQSADESANHSSAHSKLYCNTLNIYTRPTDALNLAPKC